MGREDGPPKITERGPINPLGVFEPSEDQPAQPRPYEGNDVVQEDFRA